jgi:CTP synthase
VITEIGGTVGDIESLPFLEAIRQFRNDVGRKNVLYVHVSYVPYIEAAGRAEEQAYPALGTDLEADRHLADIIICRADRPIDEDVRRKISLFSDTELESVIPAENAPTLYSIPLTLHEERLDELVLEKLGLAAPTPDLTEWRALVDRMLSAEKSVKVPIVGKYVKLQDAYLSVVEALGHAGGAHGVKVDIDWIDAEDLTGPEASRQRLEGRTAFWSCRGSATAGRRGR